MAVAFDIGADEAGAAMANWRAGMGLTQEDVAALADTVNYLSNNMNATAADLTTVIQRQGATAMAAGLAEQEVAALGAALLSGGAAPEIAATAGVGPSGRTVGAE
jgi:TP901 family phage tail tape measure protein